MKKLIFITAAVMLLILNSCNENSANPNIAEDPTVPSQVPEAPEVIQERVDSSVIYNSDWRISHITKNGQLQENDENLNAKLTFDQEGNYTWKSDKVNNIGRWSFDSEKEVILCESSDPDLTSEWTVKHRRSVMVWIGTSRYGQHSIQMMLNKVRAAEIQ